LYTADCRGIPSYAYYLATGRYEQQKNGVLFGIAKAKTLFVVSNGILAKHADRKKLQWSEITPN